MTAYAIQAGALRENPNSGPDGVGVQADIAYTLEARAEVQAVCGIAAPMPRHDNDNTPSTGRPISFISMFSGIEAASVAFGPLGWKPICFAEIEKFPSAVLAHHYPDVPNVGDMSKHDWSQYAGKVDIVCGGPPCQDFSIAGLRAGLDGARGNLSITYMRALHAIKPRNAIVENVPGWLNDKKNAFGCFLAGLVGADDPLRTPDGKSWPNAGMVAGPLGRAAWRVLDAQYFALAQRRRRVIVVADFGNGADPAAVLFERKGLFGNSPPSREAGKDVAGAVANGFASSGDGYWREGIGPLRAREQDSHESLAVYAPEIARCDATREGSSQDYESTTMVAIGVTGTTSHALTAEGADASEDGTGRWTPVVVAFNAEAQADQLPGVGRDTDVNDGLMVSQRAAVAITAQTVAIRGRDCGATAELGGEVATALRASQGGGDKPHVLETREVAGAITSNYGKQLDNSDTALGPNVAIHHSAVRRLTPMECERLQGFMDNYTRIPIKHYAQRKITKNRPADMWEKDHNGGWWLMAADGNRYKALGNSWAVPKFTWLGRRIAQFMPATTATTIQEAA